MNSYQISLNKLLDMEKILTLIISDIEIIIQIQNNYISRHSDTADQPEKKIDIDRFNQVTFSYLFLTLCKYIEFYDKYKGEINALITDDSPRAIRNELIKLKIRDYRNSVIGHIHDKKTKRPLSEKQYNDFFDGIDKAHKSFYAFWLKMDSYHFTEGAPLVVTLKNILLAIHSAKEIAK